MIQIIPFIVYIALLVGYYLLSRRTEVFQARDVWWVNGVSLFAVSASITGPLLYSGLMYNEGISGLWLVWSGYLVAGFLPFVFAPMWARLNFITDNQFILFRFSGKSAVSLHLFRAIYVGLFVVAIGMGFQLTAFLKVITYYTGLDRTTSFGVLSGILLLLAFKNRLGINLRLDGINSLLFFGIFAAGFYALFTMDPIPGRVAIAPQSTNIFPENTSYLVVLLLVQSWSVNLFDGSGVQAQRFFATKDKTSVWKVAALASSLGLVFSLTLVGIVYCGMSKIGPPAMEDGELHIMHYLDQGISPWLRPLLPIAFFAIFITTYEGMLNWGASFLSIDGYQTYVDKHASPRRMKLVSTGSMLLITALSLSICWYTENLTSLIKILLSISAGVAPVFVLRWFWMRINAWSQLAAMLSSGVYTLLYRAYVSGTGWEQQAVEISGLNVYSVQLIAITVSTTATWIGVMYTTQKDDTALLEKFKATFATGIDLRSNLVKALVFGLVMVGILVAGLMWVVGFL